jgi:hypothetical protein
LRFEGIDSRCGLLGDMLPELKTIGHLTPPVRAGDPGRVLRKWRHLLPYPLTSLHRAWFKKIWRTRMPRRWLDTLYAVLNNSLPTATKVLHRNLPNSCPMCHQPDQVLSV